ncbi:MAG: CRTAC1 family protein [Acidobacteriota bacterium]
MPRLLTWSLPTLVLVSALTAAGLAVSEPSQVIPPFTEITEASGIRFQHISGDQDAKRFIFEAKGGGVAALDFDNDGRMDLVLVQGSTLDQLQSGRNPGPVLYRNVGNNTFVDVTQGSGLEGGSGWGMGVAVGDYDNDGWADLYLTRLGPNVLYRNNGDGTFSDATGKAGVGNSHWSTSAAFGDYDQDGDLDLYVCNYLLLDLKQLPEPGSRPFCFYLGQPVLCGPRGIAGSPDVLYRNNGDGTFTDVSREAGISLATPLPGLGVVWADVDNDGDLDLYVGNDAQANLLFLNRGNGTFQEKGLSSGVALSGDAREQASMGIDVADYDNDGRLDFFVTHFAADYSTLYHNEGNLVWEDATIRAGLRKSYGLLVGWGTRFADFNLDGWKDLYHSNGHVYPFLNGTKFEETYLQPGTLFLNQQDGTFKDVSDRAGAALRTKKCGRGVAFADFDNDGDMDVAVASLNDSPQLLRNDLQTSNHWISFRTVGTKSNRDGIGARIRVVTGKLEQIWDIKRTVGIYSASDPRAHFGLGTAAKADRVEIRWPSGTRQEFRAVEGNHHYRLEEGQELRIESPVKGR